MREISSTVALANSRTNRFNSWNRSTSSSELSDKPNDAAPRIYDGFADVKFVFDGDKLSDLDGVFAIGSCFAIELQAALQAQSKTVLSLDETADDPVFVGKRGLPNRGYFHRYTPAAMAQEFLAAFEEAPGWSLEETLIFESDGQAYDLFFGWDPEGDMSLAAALKRRRIARDLVRTVAKAKLVVVTLGLIETWRHLPSGFCCNKIAPRVLARSPGDFSVEFMAYDEIMASLETIRSCIARHHETGDFKLVVTVSPVPLQKTFSDLDIVVANAESKATLRAAASAFARLHNEAYYFPSYEIVQYSQRDLAWRPDRIHVNRDMVDHIMRKATVAFFKGGDAG